MALHAELARLNAAPELPEWIVGTVQKLIDQAQEQAAEPTRLSEQVSRRDTELHAVSVANSCILVPLFATTLTYCDCAHAMHRTSGWISGLQSFTHVQARKFARLTDSHHPGIAAVLPD